MARFAFTEEWLSLRASKILPYLSKDHEIHYIASGTDIPQADFASVKLFKFPRYQQQNSLRIANATRKLCFAAGQFEHEFQRLFLRGFEFQVPLTTHVR